MLYKNKWNQLWPESSGSDSNSQRSEDLGYKQKSEYYTILDSQKPLAVWQRRKCDKSWKTFELIVFLF